MVFRGYSYKDTDKIFNIDQLFTERLDRRLDQLDIFHIESNQVARYRILHNIFIGTHFKYKTDVVIKIKNKFTDLKRLLNTNTGSGTNQSKQQQQAQIISVAEVKLDELQYDIMNLLYQCDLICLKKKEYKTPEDEVAGDY